MASAGVRTASTPMSSYFKKVVIHSSKVFSWIRCSTASTTESGDAWFAVVDHVPLGHADGIEEGSQQVRAEVGELDPGPVACEGEQSLQWVVDRLGSPGLANSGPSWVSSHPLRPKAVRPWSREVSTFWPWPPWPRTYRAASIP